MTEKYFVWPKMSWMCLFFVVLARYTEFLREEEERLVEHAKSLTAAMDAARRLRGEESGDLRGEPPLREGSSGAAEGVRGEHC